ncbi:biotin/lipoyl-binding protein, partial [Enterovibrio norvegicus]
MSDANKPSDEEETDKGEQSAAVNSARRFTYYLIALALVIWFYTLWADRVTPMTSHGRVNGQLIRISPQVSGPISSISVVNNAEVKRNQALLAIEKSPFQLNVESARLALQQASQSVNADS